MSNPHWNILFGLENLNMFWKDKTYRNYLENWLYGDSSQGSYTGQLDICNWQTDDNTTK